MVGLWVILILPLALSLHSARIFQNRMYFGIIEKKRSYKMDRKLHVKDLENSELILVFYKMDFLYTLIIGIFK